MKILIFAFILLFSITVVSQETMFSNYEKKNLIELTPKLSDYKLDNIKFNKDLKELLYFDERQTQNKVWAFVFTGIGLVSGGLSVALSNKDQPLTDLFGVVTVATSVVSFGTSIPFYIGHSKNKKRKREKLIFINSELDKFKN